MNIKYKSSGGIQIIPLEAELLGERRIFLQGEINEAAAREFFKQVMYLNSVSSYEPIHVMIDSFGGQIDAGMIIYDVIRSSKAPIKMYCIGTAYSMGAVLLSSGQHGRYILPHGKTMLHEPLLGNRVSGNASSLQSISENLLKTRDRMNKLLAENTGRSEEEIQKATSFDNYMGAEESVAFGLADKIMTFSEMMEG